MEEAELRRLPKALLHDHLDGGLRIDTIVDLAAEQGYEGLPSTDPAVLGDWFYQGSSGSLERYLEAFRHTVGVMQTAPAVERVAYEAVVDLAADGVVYAEIRFAPTLLMDRGLSFGGALEAALRGFRQGERETGTAVRAIVVAVRDRDDSEKVATEAADYAGRGVVGFDLAGPEAGFPATSHLAGCIVALDAGLALTLHAGEGDGPESIALALKCGAQRIGHGVRLAEDLTADGGTVRLGDTAAAVRRRRIPLEICISSNIHTGVCSDASAHPLGTLHRAGFDITLNTDNRLMSRTTMSREFDLAIAHHGFGPEDLLAVTETALRAGFAEREVRRRILEDVVRPAYAELL